MLTHKPCWCSEPCQCQLAAERWEQPEGTWSPRPLWHASTGFDSVLPATDPGLTKLTHGERHARMAGSCSWEGRVARLPQRMSPLEWTVRVCARPQFMPAGCRPSEQLARGYGCTLLGYTLGKTVFLSFELTFIFACGLFRLLHLGELALRQAEPQTQHWTQQCCSRLMAQALCLASCSVRGSSFLRHSESQGDLNKHMS